MPRFSLIVATLGRTYELRNLLDSLTRQSFSDYEVVVVDQNDDDRISPILLEYPLVTPYKHIRCAPGLSMSRNAGLKVAAGEVIAFPDDDCRYTPELLANVDNWFRKHVRYSIFAVGAKDEEGIPSGNRWIQSKCDLRSMNIFRTTFSSTLFIRRDARSRDIYFDESLGLGSRTIFDCGEETDFVLQLMDAGMLGRFDRTWHIIHPRRDMVSSTISRQRAVGYGRGMGRVLRKHSLYIIWMGLVAYDFIRAVAVAFRGQKDAALLCLAHCRGICEGFSAGRYPDVQLNQDFNL